MNKYLPVIVFVVAFVGFIYYMSSVNQAKPPSYFEAQQSNSVKKNSLDEMGKICDNLSSSNNKSDIDDNIGREICSEVSSMSKYINDRPLSIGDQLCEVSKVSGNYAEGGFTSMVSCDYVGGPGIAWLGTKIDGKWLSVAKSQDTWDCATLKKYDFPKGFAPCYNWETEKENDY